MTQPPNADSPTDEDRAQAREYVVQRLAAVSAAVWAAGMLAFMFFIFPNGNFKPTVGMALGVWLLALAALPWVAYVPLVERVARRHPWRQS